MRDKRTMTMSLKWHMAWALLGLLALLGAAIAAALWGRHTARQQHQDALRRYEAMQTSQFARQVSAVKSGRARRISLYEAVNTDAKMQELVQLDSLDELMLEQCDLSEEGMKSIAAIPSLKTFYYMYYWRVGDEGLVHLAKTASLETLVVVESDVTPKGLRALQRTASLRSLVYYESDAPRAQPEFAKDVITTLSGFRNLEFLGIGGPWLTEADIREIRRALPKAKVRRVTEEMTATEMLRAIREESGDTRP